jgi:hypothetical protein
MEALFDRTLTKRANRDRRLPGVGAGYLSQPEMRQLIDDALGLDWTLISYEADMPRKPTAFKSLSIEETNWREEQQTQNIAEALAQLPADAPLLVWCGNHHLAKNRTGEWQPMGTRVQIAGKQPFAIDQVLSVIFDPSREPIAAPWANEFSDALSEHGGTAGFLAGEAPPAWPWGELADAFLLSTENRLT